MKEITVFTGGATMLLNLGQQSVCAVAYTREWNDQSQRSERLVIISVIKYSIYICYITQYSAVLSADAHVQYLQQLYFLYGNQAYCNCDAHRLGGPFLSGHPDTFRDTHVGYTVRDRRGVRHAHTTRLLNMVYIIIGAPMLSPVRSIRDPVT
jgi:hypothetical protein